MHRSLHLANGSYLEHKLLGDTLGGLVRDEVFRHTATIEHVSKVIHQLWLKAVGSYVLQSDMSAIVKQKTI